MFAVGKGEFIPISRCRDYPEEVANVFFSKFQFNMQIS